MLLDINSEDTAMQYAPTKLVREGREILSPVFQAEHPHVKHAFSYDAAQCAPKFSVRAVFDLNAMDAEDRKRWEVLRAAVLQTLRGKPLCGDPVKELNDSKRKVNLSCMKHPRLYGKRTKRLSDSEMFGKPCRAMFVPVPYNTRNGGRGVVLGLRAFEVAKEVS